MKRFLSLTITLALTASASFAAEEVPLAIELPKPLFVGTPRPVQLPHLEKPRTGKRPDGTTVTIMPFENFKAMNDTELDALFTFLKSLPPKATGSR